MAISIVFVVLLFARWEAFLAQKREWMWWLLLVVFLALDFLFLLVPIRDRHSIRQLSVVGKAWAASAWLLVFVFLLMVVPAQHAGEVKKHPLVLAGAGLVLLGMLVLAIWRLSSSWIREPLRSIIARESGGFLLRFEPQAGIATAVRTIPGAEPGTETGEWVVPANANAAAALMQFARQFDFDFVPTRRGRAEELIRGG
jgi:hypothetical protein